MWANAWHGPSVLIGFERNNAWVSHRGTVIKVFSRHLRRAEPDETVHIDDAHRVPRPHGPDPDLAAPGMDDAYSKVP